MKIDSSTTEFGSTEEVVRALLEYLVDPLLPLNSFCARATPSISQQESVAKQVHATVLLYNYYQRKRHPELQFLDFEPFCKLAVTLKPSLMLHMKSTHQLDLAKLDDLENQLSPSEKAIMNACSVSRTLFDTENLSSSLKEWPIIKVAVLLVDSTKDNCLLMFSSTTNGVWSVIEKDFDSENIAARNKRKRLKMTRSGFFGEHEADDEARYQHVAFSAVKEKTGIDKAELKVLESNVVCNLSKEKTLARFYIVQCNKAINEDLQVPIKDAIDSLQGPLVVKSSGSWIATPVIEYFHLLPYAGIVSKWYSREFHLNCMEESVAVDVLSISQSSVKPCKETNGKAEAVFSNNLHDVKAEPDSVEINTLNMDKPCENEVSDTIDSSDKSCLTPDVGKEAVGLNLSEVTENPCDKEVIITRNYSDKEATVAIKFTKQKNCERSQTTDFPNSKSGPDSMDIDENPAVCPPKENVNKSIDNLHDVKVGPESVQINISSMDKPCANEISDTIYSSDKSCVMPDVGKEAVCLNLSEVTENPCDKEVIITRNFSDKEASVSIEFSKQKDCEGSHIIDLLNSTSGPHSTDIDENPAVCPSKENANKGINSLYNVKVGPESVEINASSMDKPFENEVSDTIDSSDKSCLTPDVGKETVGLNLSEVTENPCDNEVTITRNYSHKEASVAIEFTKQKDCKGSHSIDLVNSTSGSNSMDTDFNPAVCPPKENVNKSINGTLKVYQYQKRRTPSIPREERCKYASINSTKTKAAVVPELKLGVPKLKTESCISECRDTNAITEKMPSVISPNLGGPEKVGHSLVPFEPKANYHEKVEVTITEKEKALSQTALKVLIRKREDLLSRLHNLEDEMALCERNIQAIIDGAENHLAIKLEALIDCCNDVCLQSKMHSQDRINQHAHYRGLHQNQMGKRLSEAILTLRTPCQASHGIMVSAFIHHQFMYR